MIKLKYKLLSETAQAPTKKRKTDAGWDFYADCMYNNDDERISLVEGTTYYITAGRVLRIGLGLATELPDDYYIHFMDRSGLGCEGIHRLAGVVEGTYRNELIACLTNLSRDTQTFALGTKIVQGIILPILDVEAEEVTELSVSDRGERGFGSSGDER